MVCILSSIHPPSSAPPDPRTTILLYQSEGALYQLHTIQSPTMYMLLHVTFFLLISGPFFLAHPPLSVCILFTKQMFTDWTGKGFPSSILRTRSGAIDARRQQKLLNFVCVWDKEWKKKAKRVSESEDFFHGIMGKTVRGKLIGISGQIRRIWITNWMLYRNELEIYNIKCGFDGRGSRIFLRRDGKNKEILFMWNRD